MLEDSFSTVYDVGMKHQTVAILVIGNEMLSGRTREANAYLAAQRLFECGCKLGEIVTIPDDSITIISALDRLRSQFDAVITSGGIGPTHDDITMESVATSFGVDLIEHGQVVKAMTEHYGAQGMNEGRKRMSRVPKGAKLIQCKNSITPGVHIGNVYVLAGVPSIFASQIDSILCQFGGRPYHRLEIEVELPESIFAKQLTSIQASFDNVEIGSYPARCGSKPHGKICLSSQSRSQLEAAAAAVRVMLKSIGAS